MAAELQGHRAELHDCLMMNMGLCILALFGCKSGIQGDACDRQSRVRRTAGCQDRTVDSMNTAKALV